MGVLISIKSNYKKLDKSLDKLGRKQLPFAFAKTLNDTMKAVGKYTTARTYPQSFEARNKAFFEASMFKGKAVTWATKSRLSVAAEDRFDRGNLELHARGGTPIGEGWTYRHPDAICEVTPWRERRTQEIASTHGRG